MQEPATGEAQEADPMQEPAVSEEQWGYIADFYRAVGKLVQETCIRCNEKWFEMHLIDGVCQTCRQIDKKGGIHLYTPENKADVGLVPGHLPKLTEIEEMLIARVHVHVQVWQVKGQQYKYKSHVVNFMQNTAKIYDRLPLLPTDLDVSSIPLVWIFTRLTWNR